MKNEFDFANPVVSVECLRNLPPGTYVVAGEAAEEVTRQAVALIIERRNVERREFVSGFVAERIKAGTWPDTDVLRLLMLNDLIDAWENRLR